MACAAQMAILGTDNKLNEVIEINKKLTVWSGEKWNFLKKCSNFSQQLLIRVF